MRDRRSSLGSFAAVLVLVSMAGCGVDGPGWAPAPDAPPGVAAEGRASSRVGDPPSDPQTAQAVLQVLQGQFPTLLSTCDRDGDGAISMAEYQPGRDAEVVQLFFEQFDLDRDGKVTADEVAQALSHPLAVSAYVDLAERRMQRAIAPVADAFTVDKLRPYMVGIGLAGDWPQIFKLFARLDLNQDRKLVDTSDESTAFRRTFVRAQLEHELVLPVEPLTP